MADLVIPDYQITLLKEKAALGSPLSDYEKSLIDSPSPPICQYLEYLKQIYPARYKSIVDSVQVTPINNYRESYNLSQILIKAWKTRKLSQLSQSEELKNFVFKYKIYHYTCQFLDIAAWFSIGYFNIIYAVPKFLSWPVFIGQNLAFYLAYRAFTDPFKSWTWKGAAPAIRQAAYRHKSDLEELHKKNEVLYQYPLVAEEFPPNEFGWKNWGFLADRKLYEHAHLDDFNGMGKNHSRWVLFKEGRWRLDR